MYSNVKNYFVSSTYFGMIGQNDVTTSHVLSQDSHLRPIVSLNKDILSINSADVQEGRNTMRDRKQGQQRDSEYIRYISKLYSKY